MLIKAKPKRLNSKGNLRILPRGLHLDTVISGFGRALYNSVPVLSIFVLVGISSYIIGLQYFFTNAEGNRAYAVEEKVTNTSASLIVDDGKIKDTIFATNGEFAYATHKVTVNATSVKSYVLTLTKTSGLTGPSSVGDANNTTPDNMNNQWGYAFIDESADPTTASFQALTTSSNIAKDINIDSNHNVEYSKQLVFGAKFGNDAANGTYSAEATLSLVVTPHIVTTYNVTYNCNGGTGCPSNLNISNDTGSYTYTIPPTQPVRSNYKFLGYSITNGNTADTNYAPGTTITLTTASPDRTLYAIWQVFYDFPSSLTTMQGMSATICKNASIGANKTLADNRDTNTYTIVKAIDGKCWMTQNLRIVNKAITSSDSDVTSNFTIPASNISSFGTSYNTNSAYYNNNTDYGAYYSWYTATAGAGTNSVSSGDVAPSICPKGWRLPSRSDYSSLATAIGAGNNAAGSTLFRNSTYKFQYAGHVNRGSLLNTGFSGYYWSRTAVNSNYAYHLYLFSSTADPASGDAKYFGFSVRCVAYSN